MLNYHVHMQGMKYNFIASISRTVNCWSLVHRIWFGLFIQYNVHCLHQRGASFGKISKIPMSISEKPAAASASNLSFTSSSIEARNVDPLLKDLNDKKQSFRRNVVSLAAELKELRSRLASQEQTYAKETLTRQVASVSFCTNNTNKFSFLFLYQSFLLFLSLCGRGVREIFFPFKLWIFFFTGSRDTSQEHGIGNWQIAEEIGRKKRAASGFSLFCWEGFTYVLPYYLFNDLGISLDSKCFNFLFVFFKLLLLDSIFMSFACFSSWNGVHDRIYFMLAF